jgi:hypothetical protein
MIFSYEIGFACFIFMVGFILLFAAAIYISPSACGSNNEKETIKKPLPIQQGSSTSTNL